VDFNDFAVRSPDLDEGYHQPHYFIDHHGVLIDKYTCGTALLIAPFFLVASLTTVLAGQPLNGYEIVFQYSVAFAALVYIYLGMMMLVKLMQTFSISRKTGFFITLAGLFASNLFFYAFIQPSLSHVYSFFAITTFCFLVRRLISHRSLVNMILAVVLLGLIVLIRPVNGLVVASIPFLAGDLQNLKNLMHRIGLRNLLFAILSFLIIISPQIILNFLQTGTPIIWHYPGEGFNFTSPALFEFLAGFRKGWLIYTPFMLLLIPALILTWKRSRYQFVTFILFIFILVYFFAAWWNWFYGDSFGMRPMVDYYGVFLLLIALLVKSVNRSARIMIVLFVGFALILNLLQTYQYTRGILHADAMNLKNYCYTFLKTGNQYQDVIGDTDEYFYGKLDSNPLIIAVHDCEPELQEWIELQPATDEKSYSGDFSLKMDTTTAFSYGYPLQVNDSLRWRNDLYVIFSARVLESYRNASIGSFFVFDIQDINNRSLFLRDYPLKRIPDQSSGSWEETSIGFRLPVLKEDAAYVRFYIWKSKGSDYYLDDLKIAVHQIL
jgi:hypothetical protein